MFVNVSTVVAAGVMIVVPFIQEVKSIVVELGRDKSKVWFQKTKYFLFKSPHIIQLVIVCCSKI